jgi:hypothetical protein
LLNTGLKLGNQRNSVHLGASHSVGDTADHQMALMHRGRCCLLRVRHAQNAPEHRGGPTA